MTAATTVPDRPDGRRDGRAGVVGRLGRLVVLTDRSQCVAPLAVVVEAVVAAGVRAVVLREKDLPRQERIALADELGPLLHDVGGVLVSAGEHLPGTDGVHLPAPRRPDRTAAAGRRTGGRRTGGRRSDQGRPDDRGTDDSGRTPTGTECTATGIVGRSCHDAAECAAAVDPAVDPAAGPVADYVTLSPFRTTRSKPGYGPALGPAGLRRLVGALPPAAGTGPTAATYALGGVEEPDHVRAAIDAGVDGVAVMGAVMRADDPGRLATRLLAAVDEAARASGSPQ